MSRPKVVVLRAAGTNCDGEAVHAWELAGAEPQRLHINELIAQPRRLREFAILTIPGGFSYGDDIAAGKILARQLGQFLGEAIRQFRDEEKLILGVCNGFQAILKSGVLLPPDPDDGPLATLTNNDPPGFQDRWIKLKATPGKCPFLKDVEQMLVPIAHGEGRFVCRAEWILRGLESTGQIVLRFDGLNPNGSQGDVAGLCDFTGRVLGLMPHPERHVLPTQHPHWTRTGLAAEGDGLKLFRNAVGYFE